MAGKLKYYLAGKRYGRLVVLERADSDKNNGTRWLCRCDCGVESIKRTSNLIRGWTTSCGCYGLEQLRLAGTKHGLSKHPLYRAYHAMLQRCYNPKHPQFARYGGRGIRVYTAWKKDPKKFIEWGLSAGWKKGLDLDRVNNDRGYTPRNCRFISHRENMYNTRVQKNRKLPIGVQKYKNRFIAHVNLGSFKTIKEARSAYLTAVLRLGLIKCA